MQAAAENLNCRDCRGEYEKADVVTPCDAPGGILKDGTCQFGMPALLPLNRLALQLYSDVQIVGWDSVVYLHDLDLDKSLARELLLRLRVIADEQRKAAERRAKEVAKKHGN